MDRQTLIFLGPQGSGKGTQAKLIEQFLKANDPHRHIVHFEAGQKLREFAQAGEGRANRAVRDIVARGAFVPTFITSYLMTKLFMEELVSDEHLIVDGFPRELRQAMVFDTAVRFYERPHPILLNILIPEEESIKRLLARGRSDDTEEKIRSRLTWYLRQVEPVLEWFRGLGTYKIIEIDGASSIEAIHGNIVEKLGLEPVAIKTA